jgi:hypothetical protein
MGAGQIDLKMGRRWDGDGMEMGWKIKRVAHDERFSPGCCCRSHGSV